MKTIKGTTNNTQSLHGRAFTHYMPLERTMKVVQMQNNFLGEASRYSNQQELVIKTYQCDGVLACMTESGRLLVTLTIDGGSKEWSNRYCGWEREQEPATIPTTLPIVAFLAPEGSEEFAEQWGITPLQPLPHDLLAVMNYMTNHLVAHSQSPTAIAEVLYGQAAMCPALFREIMQHAIRMIYPLADCMDEIKSMKESDYDAYETSYAYGRFEESINSLNKLMKQRQTYFDALK